MIRRGLQTGALAAAVLVVLLVAGSLCASLVYATATAHHAEAVAQAAVHRSEHAWCSIIRLSLADEARHHAKLTARQARGYHAILDLGRAYGCLATKGAP